MSDRRRILGLALRIAVAIAIIVALNRALVTLVHMLEMDFLPETADALRNGIWATALLYALLLAIPFVPGVEIGIGLLTMFGRDAALIVYGSTVFGLSLAFAVGRLVPLSALIRCAVSLRQRRLAAMLRRMEGLPDAERLSYLTEHAPGNWGPWLIRNRYLALAGLLNVPGNALIGGGGGIALMAGMSRLFSPAAFGLTVLVAVSPVPLTVWFLGATILSPS